MLFRSGGFPVTIEVDELIEEVVKKEDISIINQASLRAVSFENQILKNGLNLFLAAARGWYGSITRITAGNPPFPNPSTYDTYQELEAPLGTLSFPKVNIVNVSPLTKGFMASFVFQRPRLSLGGIEITELGLEVSNGIDFALLSRITAESGQILHHFSTTQDTLITYDLKFEVT